MINSSLSSFPNDNKTDFFSYFLIWHFFGALECHKGSASSGNIWVGVPIDSKKKSCEIISDGYTQLYVCRLLNFVIMLIEV